MKTTTRQDVIVVLVAALSLGAALSMLLGSKAWGVLCFGSVALLSAATYRVRGARGVLRLTNLALAAVGLTLSVFFIRDYAGRVSFSVMEREGASPLLDGKRIVLPELKTVYCLVSPSLAGDAPSPPAAVLLHGNGGTGTEVVNDTKWNELAAAKGWVLIAPTSPGQTWSDDAHRVIIGSMNDAAKRVRFDRSRILLTGRSDGATWCYNVGLRYPNVFRAIAPVSGTFWPLARAYVHRSESVAVYVYHSARDHLFPVEQARGATALLKKAGHEVTYFEDAAGGHEYSPEQARRIAKWFAGLSVDRGSPRADEP